MCLTGVVKSVLFVGIMAGVRIKREACCNEEISIVRMIKEIKNLKERGMNMQAAKLSVLLGVCVAMVLTNGCNSQVKDLKIQNNTQQKRIYDLESQLQAAKLELEQLQRTLQASEGRGNIETDAMKQKLAALQQEVAAKQALIEKMQHQLVYGGAQLPAELNTLLEDFAKGKDMITYDASKGMLKFKSDLLFEKGSDVVAPAAADALKQLCTIMEQRQAKQFDLDRGGTYGRFTDCKTGDTRETSEQLASFGGPGDFGDYAFAGLRHRG